MKTCKKTTLLRNNGAKERQEDYPSSAVYVADIVIVFLSFFSTIVS